MANLKMYLAVGVLGITAWNGLGNYMDNQERISKVAVEHNLSEEETEAMYACRDQMKNKSVILANEVSTGVSDDICACQSKTMVKVFKPEAYDSHASIVSYLTKGSDRSKLNLEQSDLISGQYPERDLKKLADSLLLCTDKAEEKHIQSNISSYRAICKSLTQN